MRKGRNRYFNFKSRFEEKRGQSWIVGGSKNATSIRFKKAFLLLIMLVLLLSGCSMETVSEEQQSSTEMEQSEIQVDYDAQYRDSESYQLLNGGWLGEEKVTNPDYYMSVSTYNDSLFTAHEISESFSHGISVDGNKLYRMRTYYTIIDGYYHPTYYLDILDSDTMNMQTIKYMEDIYLGDITVSCGRVLTVVTDLDEDSYVNYCHVVEMKMDGTIEVLGDIFPFLEENDLLPPAQYALEFEIRFDAASEKMYILKPDLSCIYGIDIYGQEEDYIIFEGFSNGVETLEYLCSTYEGIPLFMSYVTEESKCRVFYLKDGEPQVLFESDFKLSVCDMSVDNKGNLIYRSMDGMAIICWNPKTGSRERIIVGTFNSMSNTDALLRNSDGELLVISSSANTLRKYSFSGPAQSVTITVDSLIYIDDEARRFFRQYEASHPGVKFSIPSNDKITERDADVYTGQLFTEIAEGKGADILLMNSDDYSNFVEKKCLMDISDIFTNEKKAEILPQLLEMGRVGEKQYAVFMEYDMNYITVNRKNWQQDTWTISDALQLIEERKEVGQPFEYLFVYQNGWVDNGLGIFNYEMESHGWLDFEKGTCDFNQNEFKHMLEICKEYQATNGQMIPQTEIMEGLMEGRILGIISMGGFVSYSSLMAESNEMANVVGYPTSGESGNVITGSGALTVNKNTEHYEIIKDFIDTIYSYDYMGNVSWSIPYSLNLYDNKIITPNDPGNYYLDSPAIRLDSRTLRPIQGKANGESYIEEYKALLKNAKPYTENRSEVYSILYEEINRYLNNSSMSVQEAVKTVQSRMEIYMAEHY